jgi:hypothetical protein
MGKCTKSASLDLQKAPKPGKKPLKRVFTARNDPLGAARVLFAVQAKG